MTNSLYRYLFLAALCAGCIGGGELDNDAELDAGEFQQGDGDGDEPATVIRVADAHPRSDGGAGEEDLVELDGSVAGDGDQVGDGDGDALAVNPCGGLGDFACECGVASCEHAAECAVAEVVPSAGFDLATVACPGPAAGGLVRYPVSRPPDGLDVWTWQCAGVNLLICKRSDGEGDGCTAARCPEGLCSGC